MSFSWWRSLVNSSNHARTVPLRSPRDERQRRKIFKFEFALLEDRLAPASGSDALLAAYGQLPLGFEVNQVQSLTRGNGDATASTNIPTTAGAAQRVSDGGTDDLVTNVFMVLPSSTSLATSPAAPVFGQAVTLTATVSATGTPTGTVTFFDGATSIGAGTLSGGLATFTTSTLATASHTLSAVYVGDTNFTGSTGTATVTVGTASTTLALTKSPAAPVYSQTVVLTATVSASAPGAGTATGTVTFFDGTTSIGSGTLTSGRATFSTTSLSVASHSLTAVYAGDPNFTGSTGTAMVVVGMASMSTSLSSSTNTPVFGQTITLTASVSNFAVTGTPTGTVTFYDGPTSIGSGAVSGKPSSGVATFTTATLTTTIHTLSAVYSGDTNFTGSTGTRTLTVAAASTTTTLTTLPIVTVYGQAMSITAAVATNAPGSGTPTGTVTFFDGTTSLGSAALSAGSVSLAVPGLAPGIHQITVVYAGSTNFAGSSLSLPQTVSKMPTTETITTSSSNPAAGQSVTVTANVSVVAPGTGTPQGTVQFFLDGVSFGTPVTLAAGVATIATPLLQGGNHQLQALYSGNDVYAGYYVPGTNIVSIVGRVSGTKNPNDGSGFSISLSGPLDVAVDAAGNVYIADTGNNVVRELVRSTGKVVTIAGTGTAGYNGDNQPATAAELNQPAGLAIDNAGNLLISDTGNDRVREIIGGQIVPVAGTGTAAFNGDNQLPTLASLNQPRGLTVDAAGDIFIADTGNERIREILATTGQITTVAGSGGLGYNGDNQPATNASFFSPYDAAFDLSGNMYIADAVDARLREVITTTGNIYTVAGNGTSGNAGDGQAATAAELAGPQSVAVDAVGNVFISDTNNARIREIVAATGNIITVAGSGSGFSKGENIPATSDNLPTPEGIAVDAAGDLFITDWLESLVREVPAGVTLTVSPAATTTTLTGAPAGPVTGQTVTLTALVSPNWPGAGTPTGTVTFFDGATTIGSGTLVNGSVTIQTATLSTTTHSLLAVYAGTAAFAASTGALSETVGRAATTTVLGSFPTKSVDGKTTTLTALVSASAPGAGSPTGTVTFFDGATSIGSAGLFGGQATFRTTALSATTHTLSAVYTGDTNFTGSTGTASVNGAAASTSTTLTTSGATLVAGQTVTLTASVSVNPPGTGTPTGTVTFFDGSTSIGSGTLSSGRATFPTATLSTSTHNLSAAYGGSTNFASSIGTTSVSVGQDSTTLSLTEAPASPVHGQTVTLTATVSPNAPGGGTPTGLISFFADSSFIGFGSLSGGSATFTTSSLSTAVHTMSATFGGTGDFGASTGTMQVTMGQASTTTSLTTSPAAPVHGQQVVLTVTVAPIAPGVGTPTGSVTFFDGTTSLGQGTLSGGSTTFATTTLSTTSHSLSAAYAGDSNFTGSTGTAPLTVGPQSTTTSLSTSPFAPVHGQTVTLTAGVSPGSFGSGPVDGTVTFFDGTTSLGQGTLSAGSATFTTAALSTTMHSLSAVYNGSADFTGSTKTTPLTIGQAQATIVLTDSPTAPVHGQTVTLTATVSAKAPGGGTPTGTVTFIDSAFTTLGSVTLSGGSATLTTTALSTATHVLTAVYSGSIDFTAGTGSATMTVAKAATTTSLSSSPAAPVHGQMVTLTATVSPSSPGQGTPTGAVTFFDGTSSIGQATLSGGSATLTTASLSTTAHLLSAVYGGSTDFTGSTGAAASTVGAASTMTTLTTSPIEPVHGQTVTLTATVSPSSPGQGTPTGAVTFFDGTSSIGQATLSGGSATLTTASLSTTAHLLSAVYGGSTDFTGSTGAAASTVGAASTTTTLTTAPIEPVHGQTVALTATVAANSPGAGTATGTVTFFDGTTSIGSGTLFFGSVTITTATLSTATHSLSAVYSGNTDFAGSTGGASLTVGPAATTTTLTSSNNPSLWSQPLSLTANVATEGPGSGIPTGSVIFLDGTSTLGTDTLNAGTAIFTTTAFQLSVGTHSFSAVYVGDLNSSGSTSASLSQVVKLATTTTLSSSLNPSIYGQALTLTAAVAVVAPGTGAPGGSIAFFDGATSLGSATLAAGQATLTIGAIQFSAGTHNLTAIFAGNTTYTSSTGSLCQVVSQAVTGTTVTTTPASNGALGAPVTITALVSAPNAGIPTGSVTFYDGATSIGSGLLNGGGIATFQTATLASGTHTLRATYLGDGNHIGRAGQSTYTVAPPAVTGTIVSSSLASVLVNTPLNLTATVSNFSNATSPTGSVTFYDGASPLGTQANSSGGIFVLSGVTFTAAANHQITAVYSPDLPFKPSTAPVFIQQVTSVPMPPPTVAAVTATKVSSSVTPAHAGILMTFTATVSNYSTAASPTGTVTFLDGTTPIGTQNSSNGGIFILPYTFATTGNHQITAVFADGTNSFKSSTAPALILQVISPQVAVGTAPTTTTATIATIPLALIDAAKARWEAVGASAAALSAASISVQALPTGLLGETTGNSIVISNNAAGFGWFVDPTPGDNTEFAGTAYVGELTATVAAAVGKMDLLTVLMHEMGHVLGLDDTSAAHTLMQEALPVGTRELPPAGALDAAFASISIDLPSSGDALGTDNRQRN